MLPFRQITALVVKELIVLWKDREALALLFIMPLFFVLVMSFALEGIYSAGTRARPIELLVVNRDKGKMAEKALADLSKLEGLLLVERINDGPIDLQLAEQLIQKEEYALALLFSETFSDIALASQDSLTETDAPVVLICDPVLNNQLLASVKGMIRGVIERRIYFERVPYRLKKEIEVWKEQAAPSQHEQLNFMVQRLKEVVAPEHSNGSAKKDQVLRSTWPGGLKKTRRPTAVEQNVPAYTIFGVYFIVLTLASGFLREKVDGTFQRLLMSPMSRTVIMMGKLLPYYFVNLIQIVLMFLVGVIIFDLHLGNLAALALVSAALAASANGMGLMVAAFCKTEAQTNGLSVLLAVALSALGGMMVPTYIMPDSMKTLSMFTPHAWALAGYHDVIIRELGIHQVLTETGVLFGFTVFFFSCALWRFRFNR
jgi:ABC-2 type transport system permease protein